MCAFSSFCPPYPTVSISSLGKFHCFALVYVSQKKKKIFAEDVNMDGQISTEVSIQEYAPPPQSKFHNRIQVILCKILKV